MLGFPPSLTTIALVVILFTSVLCDGDNEMLLDTLIAPPTSNVSLSVAHPNDNVKYLNEMFLNERTADNVFGCNTSDPDYQCKPDKEPSSKRCHYIHKCCGSTIEVQFVDYLTFIYCTMNSFEWLGIIILFVIVIYAFIILGKVADDYFAPIMGEIADTLGVSHNVAGVTFLALGNGAPDISSSISAIRHGGNQTLLGIGALLGAAVFDPIAVSAVIATVCDNPKVARRPLLRDCFFLSVAAAYVLFITEFR